VEGCHRTRSGDKNRHEILFETSIQISEKIVFLCPDLTSRNTIKIFGTGDGVSTAHLFEKTLPIKPVTEVIDLQRVVFIMESIYYNRYNTSTLLP